MEGDLKALKVEVSTHTEQLSRLWEALGKVRDRLPNP